MSDRDSLCDQSSYELIRLTQSGLHDLFHAICEAQSRRSACAGEDELLEHVDAAMVRVLRARSCIERNKVAELVWPAKDFRGESEAS